MKSPLPLDVRATDAGVYARAAQGDWQPVSADLTRFLLDVGAFFTKHSGRSLGAHLLGVYTLLKDAGCEEHICLGGGLHSVYGTDVFRVRTMQESARPQVARAFGKRAEGLAWLFGHLTRRTRSIEKGLGNPDETRALRLIEAANLLEQGGSLAGWPNISAAWEHQKEKRNG